MNREGEDKRKDVGEQRPAYDAIFIDLLQEENSVRAMREARLAMAYLDDCCGDLGGTSDAGGWIPVESEENVSENKRGNRRTDVL